MPDDYVCKTYCQLQHDNTNSQISRIEKLLELNSQQTKEIHKMIVGNGEIGIYEKINIINSKVDNHLTEVKKKEIDNLEGKKLIRTYIWDITKIGIPLLLGGAGFSIIMEFIGKFI